VSAENYGHRLALWHMPSVPSCAHCLSCGVATAFSHPRTHPLCPAPRFTKEGLVQSFANSSRCARHACPHTQTITPCSLYQQGARDDTRAPQEPPLHPLARRRVVGWCEQESVVAKVVSGSQDNIFSLLFPDSGVAQKGFKRERKAFPHVCCQSHNPPTPVNPSQERRGLTSPLITNERAKPKTLVGDFFLS
jgi:hypothetical protein